MFSALFGQGFGCSCAAADPSTHIPLFIKGGHAGYSGGFPPLLPPTVLCPRRPARQRPARLKRRGPPKRYAPEAAIPAGRSGVTRCSAARAWPSEYPERFRRDAFKPRRSWMRLPFAPAPPALIRRPPRIAASSPRCTRSAGVDPPSAPDRGVFSPLTGSLRPSLSTSLQAPPNRHRQTVIAKRRRQSAISAAECPRSIRRLIPIGQGRGRSGAFPPPKTAFHARHRPPRAVSCAANGSRPTFIAAAILHTFHAVRIKAASHPVAASKGWPAPAPASGRLPCMSCCSSMHMVGTGGEHRTS